ncbi:MAG: dihydrofolate reductase family protein [Gaiellales bacterium]
MGKIVVSQFVTLDGVMEDPGGAEGFAQGGWAFQYDRGPEGDTFKLDELMASDALLLGRTTFEGFAAAWPSRTGAFADKFNGMRKYVVSETIGEPGWNNTVVLRGAVAAEIARLRAEPGGDILVNGSAQLSSFLLAHRLVDELRLMVYPVVLGAGKRLFADGVDATLALVGARPSAQVVILTYAPAEAAS